MKIQDILMEQGGLDKSMFSVAFLGNKTSRHDPDITLTIFGNNEEVELVYTIDADFDVSCWEDSFGWEQGDAGGTERWEECELVDAYISSMTPVIKYDYSYELSQIFGVAEYKVDNPDKIHKFICDLFGGERNFVVFIAEKNQDMVGYVLLTPGRKPYSYAKIQQIAVREDARRLEYGSALLEVVKDFCNTHTRMGVTLRCRVDLESNNFWKSLGFYLYGVWEKRKVNHVGFKASDDINLWKIDLNDQLLTLFSMDETDSGLWVMESEKMYL